MLRTLYDASPTLKIRSVVRITLMQELIPILSSIKPGKVLDVGAKDSPCRGYIPCSDFTTLDICPETTPDICCDLHDLAVAPATFDTVIALEVLEHLYEPQKAVREIFRVLKPGGTLVASTRFIYRYHPDPHDYYRFTPDSLGYLCSQFSEVDIVPHGNGLHAAWHIANNDYRASRVFLNVLNPFFAWIGRAKSAFPLGYVVRAKK